MAVATEVNITIPPIMAQDDQPSSTEFAGDAASDTMDTLKLSQTNDSKPDVESVETSNANTSPNDGKEKTDGVNEDEEFFRTQLKQTPQVRKFILEIEEKLVSFINDTKSNTFKFQTMNTFHRMIVHRMCAIFGVDHTLDQTKKSIVVGKTEFSKIPVFSFREMFMSSEAQSEAALSKRKPQILKRVAQDPAMGSMRRVNEARANKTYEEKNANYNNAKSRIFQATEPSKMPTAISVPNVMATANVDTVNRSNKVSPYYVHSPAAMATASSTVPNAPASYRPEQSPNATINHSNSISAQMSGNQFANYWIPQPHYTGLPAFQYQQYVMSQMNGPAPYYMNAPNNANRQPFMTQSSSSSSTSSTNGPKNSINNNVKNANFKNNDLIPASQYQHQQHQQLQQQQSQQMQQNQQQPQQQQPPPPPLPSVQSIQPPINPYAQPNGGFQVPVNYNYVSNPPNMMAPNPNLPLNFIPNQPQFYFNPMNGQMESSLTNQPNQAYHAQPFNNQNYPGQIYPISYYPAAFGAPNQSALNYTNQIVPRKTSYVDVKSNQYQNSNLSSSYINNNSNSFNVTNAHSRQQYPNGKRFYRHFNDQIGKSHSDLETRTNTLQISELKPNLTKKMLSDFLKPFSTASIEYRPKIAVEHSENSSLQDTNVIVKFSDMNELNEAFKKFSISDGPFVMKPI